MYYFSLSRNQRWEFELKLHILAPAPAPAKISAPCSSGSTTLPRSTPSSAGRCCKNRKRKSLFVSWPWGQSSRKLDSTVGLMASCLPSRPADATSQSAGSLSITWSQQPGLELDGIDGATILADTDSLEDEDRLVKLASNTWQTFLNFSPGFFGRPLGRYKYLS
jgi:hypothetical protein